MRTLYQVRSCGGMRVEIISDALPFRCAVWCGPNGLTDAVEYAKFHSRSHDAVVLVFDESGKVIETHESQRGFQRAIVVTKPARNSTFPTESDPRLQTHLTNR
jgi:peroxiredoxin